MPEEKKEVETSQKITVEDLTKRIDDLEKVVTELINALKQPQQQQTGSNPEIVGSIISKLIGSETASTEKEDPFRQIGLIAVRDFMRTMIRRKIPKVH